MFFFIQISQFKKKKYIINRKSKLYLYIFHIRQITRNKSIMNFLHIFFYELKLSLWKFIVRMQ